jgi:transcription elongation factor GreA
MPEKEYITKEKYAELEKELHELETVKRKQVAEHLEYARSMGDLSENAEYHDARNEQAEIETRIEKIREILKYAEILKPGKHSEDVVVGSIVTVSKKGEKENIVYTIVGSEEVDIDSNKVSHQSPIGSAMLGKKKGENFIFQTPKGSFEYKIVDIA